MDKGKLGEKDKNLPNVIIFLNNIWKNFLNEISLGLNLNGN